MSDDFDRLNKKADEGELTPAMLQEELNKYAEAYRQEFEVATAKAPEDAAEAARDFFRKNLATAMAQVVWLSVNADSETVRLNASKSIITLALAESRDDGDPVKKILAELMESTATA